MLFAFRLCICHQDECSLKNITKVPVLRWDKAVSCSSWDWVHQGFSAFQAWLKPASYDSLEIHLAANMLWKALISYLGRSSMHKDNKPYLILLCSLMSQLKGLVLPLAMGLAERIVCRLVNAGLWSVHKMLVLSRRCSCMRTLPYWQPPTFLCQMAQWKTLFHPLRSRVTLITSDKPVLRAKTKKCKSSYCWMFRRDLLLFCRWLAQSLHFESHLSQSALGSIEVAVLHVFCPVCVHDHPSVTQETRQSSIGFSHLAISHNPWLHSGSLSDWLGCWRPAI